MASELNKVMTDPRTIIAKAASLACGHRYSALQSICEEQKTISARKLQGLIEQLHEGDKRTALMLREIADSMNRV